MILFSSFRLDSSSKNIILLSAFSVWHFNYRLGINVLRRALLIFWRLDYPLPQYSTESISYAIIAWLRTRHEKCPRLVSCYLRLQVQLLEYLILGFYRFYFHLFRNCVDKFIVIYTQFYWSTLLELSAVAGHEVCRSGLIMRQCYRLDWICSPMSCTLYFHIFDLWH